MRIRAAVSFLCMLGGVCVAAAPVRPAVAQQDVLQVAITATAQGFSVPEANGGLAGFNVEIINEACRRMERKCQLTEMAFRDVLPAVAAGRVDIGVANTLKTPEREKQVLFTIPYWRSTSSFVGKSGQPLPDLTALLTGRRVCAIAGARQEGFLRGLPGANEKAVVPRPSNRDTLLALRDGECDFAFVPTMQALPFLQAPEGAGFAFRGLPLIEKGLGGDVHMVVTPGNTDLLKALDAALAGLIRDGAHERISRRYFPFSIL